MLRTFSAFAAERWRPWAVRLGLASLVAGGLAYVPYHVLDGASARRLQEMREELERARGAIAVVKRENSELRRDIAALKEDPLAIEEIARDELGMVFPGELVIRVEEAR